MNKSGKTSKSKSKSKSSKKPVSSQKKTKKNNLNKAIENVIHQRAEKKFVMKNYIADKVTVYGAGLNYNGTTNKNGWSSGYTDSYGIIPLVAQGTGQGNRIGTKIAPTSCFLRYSINALFTTDSTSGSNFNPFKAVPFRVRVIVYRHRNDLTDYTQGGMVDVGNGVADFTNDLDTYFRPYNRDEYKIVYSAMHRMYPLRHVSGTGTTTENMPPQCANFIQKKVKLPLPKILKFNDNPTILTNQATNEAYFLAFAVVNDDGSNITMTQSRIEVSAETGMYYYDM